MLGTLAPWFGSNRTLAKYVGQELEKRSWVGLPFAGGMSELLYIDASSIVVNDLHSNVINLAIVCADRIKGPQLYRRLRRTVFHPSMLDAAHIQCGQELSSEDAAYWYFVSAWMGRSAISGTVNEFKGKISTRWTAIGGDSNTRFRSATGSIVEWRKIFRRCNFSCEDCFIFLDRCSDTVKHGLYCDPPFPGPGDNYKHKFTEEQHRRLAIRLSTFEHTRIVCRFYDVPLIRELYKESDWRWRYLTGRKQSNAEASEVLLIKG